MATEAFTPHYVTAHTVPTNDEIGDELGRTFDTVYVSDVIVNDETRSDLIADDTSSTGWALAVSVESSEDEQPYADALEELGIVWSGQIDEDGDMICTQTKAL